MQQRLLEIGDWLKINGEAIYGTRAYITSKKGEQINPETNKTIFFTRKNSDVYILCLKWPENGIILTGVSAGAAVRASMVGNSKPVSVSKSGNKLVIMPPKLTPDDNESAYVFKLTGLIK